MRDGLIRQIKRYIDTLRRKFGCGLAPWICGSCVSARAAAWLLRQQVSGTAAACQDMAAPDGTVPRLTFAGSSHTGQGGTVRRSGHTRPP
jgi:hypothetical protein